MCSFFFFVHIHVPSCKKSDQSFVAPHLCSPQSSPCHAKPGERTPPDICSANWFTETFTAIDAPPHYLILAGECCFKVWFRQLRWAIPFIELDRSLELSWNVSPELNPFFVCFITAMLYTCQTPPTLNPLNVKLATVQPALSASLSHMEWHWRRLFECELHPCCCKIYLYSHLAAVGQVGSAKRASHLP